MTSAEDVEEKITSGKRQYYSIDPLNGHKARVIVVRRNGRPYLKTQNDGDMMDNLLTKPDCL